MKYYAHSKAGEPAENWQPLEEHLANVAEMRWNLLVYPAEKSEYYKTSLWHAFGKTQKLFVSYQIKGLYDLPRTQRPDAF
jgi:hypothetical protein